MIIIHKPTRQLEAKQILEALGFKNYNYYEEREFCEAMRDDPSSKSLYFGHYNENLIICDSLLLTPKLDGITDPGEFNGPQSLITYERVLCSLFPDCEILSLACESNTNCHMYSLVLNNQKARYKFCADGYEMMEFGDLLEEEKAVYANSKVVNGQRLFKSPFTTNGEYEYTEDSMMEDFAFGVAKRHLGVKISTVEDIELCQTKFKRYKYTLEEKLSASQNESPNHKSPSADSFRQRLLTKIGLSKSR